jgi:hypothetical protein
MTSLREPIVADGDNATNRRAVVPPKAVLCITEFSNQRERINDAHTLVPKKVTEGRILSVFVPRENHNRTDETHRICDLENPSPHERRIAFDRWQRNDQDLERFTGRITQGAGIFWKSLPRGREPLFS